MYSWIIAHNDPVSGTLVSLLHSISIHAPLLGFRNKLDKNKISTPTKNNFK